MKKTISISLIIAMLIGLLTQVSFAESSDILNIDFEDGNIGVLTAKDGAAIADLDAADGSHCLSIDKVNGVARIMFASDSAQALTGGKYNFEFDVRVGWGGLSMSLFRIGDNYGDYGKGIFSIGTQFSSPKRGLKAYTVNGAKKPPSGNAGSESYIKGYRALGASQDMALTANKWHHIVIEADFDAGTTVLSMDGVQSAPVTGFDYLSGIAGIGFKWSPLKGDCDDSQKEAYIDNIRIYRAPAAVSGIRLIRANGKDNTSLSAVSPRTNKISVSFSETMDAQSVAAAVSLKNLTDDAQVSLTLDSSFGDEFIFSIDGGALAENSDYRLNVGECAAASGSVCTKYEMNFSTVDVASAERISYFKADFEGETVGSDASNMHGYGTTAKNFAVVEEDGSNKYINNTGSRVSAWFDTGATSGTLTAEFDMNFSAGMGIGIVYKNSTATYGKWMLGIAGGKGKLMYYDKGGIVPPAISAGHTFDLTDESGNGMNMTFGEWHHCKLNIDMDTATFNMEIDGVKSAQTTAVPFLIGTADGGIGGISFFNSTPSGAILLDNFDIYQSDCGVAAADALGIGGEVIDGKLPSSAKSIRVKFNNSLSVVPTAELVNKTSGETEEISETWDAANKFLTVAPAKGYFDSESIYELTVKSGYTDVFDQVCDADFIKEFVTDKGGLNIMGLSVTKDGAEVASAAQIGGTVSVRADYVLTENSAACGSALLTAVLENGGRIAYMAHGIVDMSKLGSDSVGFDFTVPEGTVFDKAYVYLWSTLDRAPMTEVREY